MTCIPFMQIWMLPPQKRNFKGTNTGVNFGENYIYAEAMINAVLYAREDYKGTGTPDMYITLTCSM